jgi:aryl-alcohol dehydrogenase-like predicted oxidoreductase
VEQLKALVQAANLKLDRQSMELLDKASAEPLIEKKARTAA